jgi:hypothetical protein
MQGIFLIHVNLHDISFHFYKHMPAMQKCAKYTLHCERAEVFTGLLIALLQQAGTVYVLQACCAQEPSQASTC